MIIRSIRDLDLTTDHLIRITDSLNIRILVTRLNGVV